MVKAKKKKKEDAEELYSIKKIEASPKKTTKKKKTTKPKKKTRKKQKKDKYEKLVEMLIENFASMQKVYSNTAQKFEDLSTEIAKLLQLFELSAKSFAEKMGGNVGEIEKDQEFLNKLNALLEQNKLIAKGLTLMEDKLKQRVYGHSTEQPQPRPNYQQFGSSGNSLPNQQSVMNQESKNQSN
jgi:hypothetical protein